MYFVVPEGTMIRASQKPASRPYFWRALASSLILLSGCTTTALESSPDALAKFSTQLRDQQPDDAFASVYNVGDGYLVWLGAKHSTSTDSLTFSLIEDAYAAFEFDTVMVEGCPTSWGPTPKRLVSYVEEAAASEEDGFQSGGETVPTILGALEQQASVFCGEPEDSFVKMRVTAAGFAEEDILGFYTLRSIPQWIRERRIEDAADPRIDDLLTGELNKNRTRLDLDAGVLPSVELWRDWYRQTNGKALAADFTTEEAGPLADGPFRSNAVGAAISNARATYLHELVISKLQTGDTVLVVYGASHLMIHGPALDISLGEGCRVQTDGPITRINDCV